MDEVVIVLFTDEEMKYIIKEKLKWKVKSGAPKNIKESLERKLYLLANGNKGE